MRGSSLFFSIALLLAAACTPPAATVPATEPVTAPGTSGLRLTAQPGGDRVTLTLTNGTSSPVGYNLCSSALERRSGGTWTLVETDEICTMELRTLQPGASATFNKRWPSNAGSGEFRYVTRVESPLSGSGVHVATDPFAR